MCDHGFANTVLVLIACLVGMVACHGGNTYVDFQKGNFIAKWVIYEVDEVEWVNFTITVPVKGTYNNI